ncbi:hypothetical protein CHELA1G2_21000 [Hyphomicrobiales bacterium]|nr:hypothetical protein CHELA1G2_21000 [Hyphomicrobiales bacterium]
MASHATICILLPARRYARSLSDRIARAEGRRSDPKNSEKLQLSSIGGIL